MRGSTSQNSLALDEHSTDEPQETGYHAFVGYAKDGSPRCIDIGIESCGSENCRGTAESPQMSKILLQGQPCCLQEWKHRVVVGTESIIPLPIKKPRPLGV